MKLSLKALLVKSLAIGSLVASIALVAPPEADAQGFGVAVHFGPAYPAAYGPGYGSRFYADTLRHDEWRRHEERVRQGEWLRHQQWERDHNSFGRPPFATPFASYGR